MALLCILPVVSVLATGCAAEEGDDAPVESSARLALDSSGCGTAALVAVNTSDQNLYRWTRPTPSSGSFTKAAKVGSNWSNIRLIASDSATGNLFAVHDNGNMYLYAFNGTAYTGGKQIGNGWSGMVQILAAGNGVIYAVHSNGNLYWYRWTGSSWASGSGNQIGRGWDGFSRVISGGNGVLYGIDKNGALQWYRHLSPSSGAGGFQGPRQVGQGWGSMRAVVGLGGGQLYAVDSGGTLLSYQHLSPWSGDARWANAGKGVQIGGGWSSYDRVAANPQACPTTADRLDDVSLVSATCTQGVHNSVVVPAGRKERILQNGSVVSEDAFFYPLGAVAVDFTTCLDPSTGTYDIAPPDTFVISVQHQFNDLVAVDPDPNPDYKPAAPKNVIPYFGHGLVFRSLSKDFTTPTDGNGTTSRYILSLNYMACSEEASAIAGVIAGVKILASLPIPGLSYSVSVAQFLFPLLVPDPEASYRCGVVPLQIDLPFTLGKDGKASFYAKDFQSESYSYDAVLQDYVPHAPPPVRVEVTLEQVPEVN